MLKVATTRDEEIRSRYANLQQMVATAIKTDRAMPDPDRRFRMFKSAAGIETYDPADYARPLQMRWKPSPRDVTDWERVCGWFSWLRQQEGGQRDLRLIYGYHAVGSFSRIAAQFGRSDETVRRWYGAALMRLLNQFWREIEAA